MKTRKTLLFLFCLIIMSLPLLVNATSIVTVSVTANSSYFRFQHADIGGQLAKDSLPISNGLVGIQISIPAGNVLTMRTVNTGSNPLSTTAAVQSVFLSDAIGNQITTTVKGGLAYFQATVTNNAQQAQTMLVTITVYDNTNSPIGYASISTMFQGRETRQTVITIPIPASSSSGIARVFADVYSTEISAGGVPLGVERSSTFGIDSQQGTAPPDTPAGSQGSYNLGITFPINAQLGTYLIQVTSSYDGLQASASKTTILSQQADFNSDGKVDAGDVTIFIVAYNNFWAHQPYNMTCDLNQDATIDANDVTIFIVSYAQFWVWQ